MIPERWPEIRNRSRTPKPENFEALSDAWSDPTAFAAELHRYYAQLEATGYRSPADDLTKPRPVDA